MKLAPIVDRLKAEGFGRVHAIRELADLQNAPERLPACFVLPESEDASPNQMSGIHDQLAQRIFGVVIMMDGAARNDDRIADDLSEQEARVIDALAGWTHPEASRACDYVGGRLLSVGGRTVSWVVRFRTARRIRKVPS